MIGFARLAVTATILLGTTFAEVGRCKFGRDSYYARSVEEIKSLAQKRPEPRELTIGWPGMDDSALVEIAKLTGVQVIHIGNSSVYSPDGKVKTVKITPAGWKALSALPKLSELTINDTLLDTAAWEAIGTLRGLKTLYLAHNDATDAGVAHLSALTELTKLGLLQRSVTDQSVPVIMKMQKLETLLVDQTAMTDEAVQRFARLPKLHTIDIRSEKMTAESVKALTNCTTLRSLTVHQRQVPADILATLRTTNRQVGVSITDSGGYLHPLRDR